MESKLNYWVMEVYENKKVTDNIYKLEIKGIFKGIPGQFYMLRCWELDPALGRPVSIHDLEEDKITFLYQVVGRGTEKLCNLRRGDEIKLLGPLGNGFSRENLKGKTAIITGGIGIAPMFYLARYMKDQSLNSGESIGKHNVDLYAGFKDNVYSIKKFQPFVDNIYVSTENGSLGIKGYVTDEFKPEVYDTVLCCGPEAMIRKVVEKCMKEKVKVYVSMEKHMACGIGACLVCTCSTTSGNKRVCKDGPVFSGEEIVW